MCSYIDSVVFCTRLRFESSEENGHHCWIRTRRWRIDRWQFEMFDLQWSNGWSCDYRPVTIPSAVRAWKNGWTAVQQPARPVVPYCLELVWGRSPWSTLLPCSIRFLLNVKLCDQSNIQRSNFASHMDRHCRKKVVSCTSHGSGCLWTGPRDDLSDHLSTCTYDASKSSLAQTKGDNHLQVVVEQEGKRARLNRSVLLNLNTLVELVARRNVFSAWNV